MSSIGVERIMSLIKLNNISKSYGKQVILSNFNLEVEKGEFIGIKGESGKGKSTLLNIIGLLEECDGKIFFEEKCISSNDNKKVQALLKNRIGYLFQNFALIDDLSVYDNLKIVLKRSSKSEKMTLIQQALEKVDLKDVMNKKVYQLSGGEQQRVAVARLILQQSDIILADEPTGSLDRKNALLIMDLLEKFHKEGKTIIMVSHDESLFVNCSRIINL